MVEVNETDNIMETHVNVMCFCKKVCITFREKKSRVHLECACNDCRQKVEWFMSQSEFKDPEFRNKVPNLWYFGNSIKQVEGRDSIKTY